MGSTLTNTFKELFHSGVCPELEPLLLHSLFLTLSQIYLPPTVLEQIFTKTSGKSFRIP